MIKEDNITYKDIEKNLPKSGLFQNCKRNCQIDTYFDFLAYTSLLTSNVILAQYKTYKNKEEPLSECCGKIINAFSTNIFNPLNEYERTLINYNKQFQIFGNESSFQITPIQFRNYLASNTKEKVKSGNQHELDDQDVITPVEQYLKTMVLCNRVTKLGKAFIECDVMNSIDTFMVENQLYFYKEEKQELLEKNKKVYDQLYNRYNIGKVDELKNFKSCYKKYYQKEITREELENSSEYQIAIKRIDKKKNGQSDIVITPDTLFRNISYKSLIERSYLMKNKMKNIALKYWLNEIKKIQENNSLNEKEKERKIIELKSYFRITECNDRNIEKEEVKNSAYNTCLNFIYQGYNIPFSVHTDRNELEEVLQSYGISIEEGEIDMKHFMDVEKNEMIELPESFELKPIIPYKFTERQLIGMDKYYEGLNVFHKDYYRKKSYLEYISAMTSNLNLLSGPKLPDEPKVDKKEQGPCL